MIIYQATKAQFLQRAWREDIDKIVGRHFVAATGHGRSPGECQPELRRFGPS